MLWQSQPFLTEIVNPKFLPKTSAYLTIGICSHCKMGFFDLALTHRKSLYVCISVQLKYGFFKKLLHYECTSCQLTISVGAVSNPPYFDDWKWSTDKMCINNDVTSLKICQITGGISNTQILASVLVESGVDKSLQVYIVSRFLSIRTWPGLFTCYIHIT